ncbi:MAG: hypothetical protein ACJ72N_05740 [Labedaea sp.]
MDENERTSDPGEQSAGAGQAPTLPMNQPDPQPAGPPRPDPAGQAPPAGSGDPRPAAHAQPAAAPQPVARRRRIRVPATTRTWVAAVIGLVLLLGGGLGGYLIGAANDHRDGRPGLSRDGRPGLSRNHRPGFGPEIRGGPPAPPFRDGRGGR